MFNITVVNTIVTILRKDIARYKWALVALVVIAVTEVVLFGTSAGLRENQFMVFLHFCTSILGVLLQYVLIVLVVQEETLSDPDAYWVTRPMPRVHILFAKIIFCVVFIVGLNTLSELFILALNGGTSRSIYALGGIIAAMPYVLIQIFLSAQTRSLPRYLLLVVCLYIGLILLAYSAAFTLFDIDFGILNKNTAPHHVALIQTMYWLLTGTGILAFLYLKRSVAKSWLFVFLASIGGLILTRNDVGIISYSPNDGMSITADLSKNKLVSNRKRSVSGINYRDYSAIIEIADVPEGADVWASVNHLKLTSANEEIELETFDYIQLLRKPIVKGRNHIYEVDLFSIRESELSKINSSVDMTMSLTLTFASLLEHSRIPLKTGNGLVHNGNRLLISSYYDTSNEISVKISAYIFDFSLEPSPIESPFEPLNGLYSFSLYNPISDKKYSGRIAKSWDMFNVTQKASATFSYSEEQAIEDLELIIYTRKVLSTNYVSILRDGVVIER